MSKKYEQENESLWYVFVHVNSEEKFPDFYIFHSSEIGNSIAGGFATWFLEPKKVEKPERKGVCANLFQLLKSRKNTKVIGTKY